MNTNADLRNNSEDSEQMPDLVLWDIQLEDAVAQDSRQVPSTNVPSVATLPASGGGNEEGTVHVTLENVDIPPLWCSGSLTTCKS